jgi:hypothetical protein
MSVVISGTDGIDKVADGAEMPPGSVLQVVSSVLTSTFSSTSGSFQDIGLSVNITPKSSTSILYLEWAGNINLNGPSGMGVSFREGALVIGGGSAQDTGSFSYLEGSSPSMHENQSMITSTPSTGFALRTFKISSKITHGSGAYSVTGTWGPSMLKITEIAA